VIVMGIRVGNKRARRLYFRQWREHFHLSQDQLGARIGTTGRTVSRIENAARDFTGRYIHAYADALGIEPIQLYGPPERPSLDAKLKEADDETVRRASAMIDLLIKPSKAS
jgi:transcriptional regulator with XRE-family HTH domain